MPKANLGDVEIFYETHGVGTPVLLVPGLGGVGAYWNPNVEAFSEKHQVITHDHRGTGQSSRSRIRYSVDRMSDDLLQLMDHLGIERAHLVGHSTGGAIGQTIAVNSSGAADQPRHLRQLDEGRPVLPARFRGAPHAPDRGGSGCVCARHGGFSLSGLVDQREHQPVGGA